VATRGKAGEPGKLRGCKFCSFKKNKFFSEKQLGMLSKRFGPLLSKK
jgi:hypothetical protein